ncbi:BofC C-terminal domain-containing protein [Bacillus sp. DJP31]|uniref:BofC C-terminal domain-containing protein n=1 Tax=Bacillus sp. DJP31 TaxID=3409789 RepID=UPI003BB68088
MKRFNQYARIFCIIILLYGLIGVIQAFAVEKGKPLETRTALPLNNASYEVTGPLTVKVILERVFLDGEVSEEIKEETIWSMEDFWSEYANWQLIDQDEEQIVFQKNIDDISPLLKSNGYFGINKDHILTIFNGKPESDQVIQSFFQIDIDKLESRQHEELKMGIPIESKDKYVEVLEVFKPFSTSP